MVRADRYRQRRNVTSETLEPESSPDEPRDQLEKKAAWGIATKHETPWYPAAAVVATLVLWQLLPKRFTLGDASIVIPILEVALLAPLIVTRASDAHRGRPVTRWLSLSLIALINVANLVSLVQLIDALVNHAPPTNSLHHAAAHVVVITGNTLLLSAADIWLTNVIVFGLWYWELDRGGPFVRRTVHHRQPDFLFPQMATPYCAPGDWAPDFVDYLYVAFTNGTAFSPTDTMPLTNWAKLLMMVQSFASLVTVALVAARAVNILA